MLSKIVGTRDTAVEEKLKQVQIFGFNEVYLLWSCVSYFLPMIWNFVSYFLPMIPSSDEIISLRMCKWFGHVHRGSTS